jgi:hypothetical protein
MEGIHGVLQQTGWNEHQQQMEYGDEHEIRLQKMEKVQQKNEGNDHVQNDIIFQVQKIGKICMMHGMHQNHQQVIYDSRYHRIG